MDYEKLYRELLNDIDVVCDITGSNHEYTAHEMLTKILSKHEDLEVDNED